MNDKRTSVALPDGAVRVPLSRPLKVPKGSGVGETSELILREPTAEDIEIAGCPITIDADARGQPKILFDEAKTSAMLERLSGYPIPYIRKMRASDWTNCAWAIAPFFVPGAS